MQLKDQAESAFRKGENAKSFALYKQYFRQSEPDLGSLLCVAKACMNLGLTRSGLKYYDQAIEFWPSHATAFSRKTCYLLEQICGQLMPVSANKHRDQISMRSLGNKGRFGNQIIQYAFLQNYAHRFNLDIGTNPWVGSYLFDICDPLPVTPPDVIRERQLDMLGTLMSGQNQLANRDITGYFQFHTEKWNNFREIFQSTFTPSDYFQSLLAENIAGRFKKDQTIVGLHLRRGDFVNSENHPVSPSCWYLKWLDGNWVTLQSPRLYIASDDPGVLNDFSQYDPVSYSSLGCDLQGLEFIVDWMMLQKASIVCASNSSFSITAAMANTTAKLFLRPPANNLDLEPFDPWNSQILY